MTSDSAPATLAAVLAQSEALGQAIVRESGLERCPLEERAFEQGEFKIRPLVSVRGRDVAVVQSLAHASGASIPDRFVRLLFLLSGLRDAGARERIAVIPYLAYARKDRRTQPRDPVNTRYVAQLLEAAGATRIVALDVHNPVALDNAFRIPVDHLSALPLFAAQLAPRLTSVPVTVLSPDTGGVKRAQLFREQLAARLGAEVELAYVAKRRVHGTTSMEELCGSVQGRTVLVIDDLCATGGTLVHAASVSLERGAARVYAVFSHAPLAEGLVRLARSGCFAEILTTDSVGDPLEEADALARECCTVLGCAPLLGEALRRIMGGRALAPLLARWPPDDAPAAAAAADASPHASLR